MTEVSCCGDGGTDVECFLGEWDAAYGVAVIQLLGTNFIVHRLQLTSGGAEYAVDALKFGGGEVHVCTGRGPRC